jgi:hypothetical protein
MGKSKPPPDEPPILSPEEIRRLVEASSDNRAPLRLYLKTDYNLELDLFRDESLVMDLLRLEFRLSRGDVGALTLTQLQYLVVQDHHYSKARTPDDRRRVLAEVAELRTKLASLPNPSPRAAAMLKALDRFPAPQADEEDPGRDYVPFADALALFEMTASELSKACKRGDIRCRGSRKRRLVNLADVTLYCYSAGRSSRF